MSQLVQLCCIVLHPRGTNQGDKCNLFLYEHCLMSLPDKLTAQKKTNMTRACFTDHFIPFLVNGVLVAKLLNSPVPASRQYHCSLDPRLSKIRKFDIFLSKSSTAHLTSVQSTKKVSAGNLIHSCCKSYLGPPLLSVGLLTVELASTTKRPSQCSCIPISLPNQMSWMQLLDL